MDSVAVFVDAGYLFAQGSAVLAGAKQGRANLSLDARRAVQALRDFAAQKAVECRLLRIYWYDGAVGGTRPTTDQALLAGLDDVKLRLGFVNSNGQQKGVDSLIVTDLIELARLKSISDAVLVSGDEDVRIGVQIAQNYGVRVHLLGIAPARGSQSAQLIQEADTTAEWDRERISGFLTLREAAANQAIAETTALHAAADLDAAKRDIEDQVRRFVEELSVDQLSGIEAYWKSARGVPPDLDRRLLPICRQTIRRKLEATEIRFMRERFQRAVKARIAKPRENG